MRQITDAQRQVAVSMPWKRIFIILAIVCTIAGLLVGGYFAFNKATPTATIPQPPVQPAPLPPVVATTPTPKPTTQSPLQVEWQSTGPEGLIGVDRIVLMDGNIYAIEQTGMKSFLIFRSEDNNSTWQKLTVNDAAYQKVAVDIGALSRADIYAGTFYDSNGGLLPEPFKYSEIVRQIFGDPNPKTEVYPMKNFTILARDPNNPNLVVVGFNFGPQKGLEVGQYPVFDTPPQLFLSVDGQKSWREVDITGIGFRLDLGELRSLAIQKEGETIRILVGTKKVWQAIGPAIQPLS